MILDTVHDATCDYTKVRIARISCLYFTILVHFFQCFGNPILSEQVLPPIMVDADGVTRSDKLGQTALHLACERGHGAVVGMPQMLTSCELCFRFCDGWL